MYETFRFVAGLLLAVVLFLLLVAFSALYQGSASSVTIDALIRVNLLIGLHVISPTVLAIGLILMANLIKDNK